MVSDTHKLVKYKNMIQIVPLSNTMEHQLIYGEGVLQLTQFSIKVEALSREALGEIPSDKKVACIDADSLDWPLLIRSWQPTDYFYPLGLRKKKKLNHFLGSLKLSPAIKSMTNVLCSDSKIAWVVGQRIDERFKITPNTKRVLKITFLSKS